MGVLGWEVMGVRTPMLELLLVDARCLSCGAGGSRARASLCKSSPVSEESGGLCAESSFI